MTNLNRRDTLKLFSGAAVLALGGTFGSASLAAAQTATPRYGGNLRVLSPTDVSTLDNTKTLETAARLLSQPRYETLVNATPEGSPVDLQPGLATSWTVSPDGLTYTLQLRPGVTFHGGRTLTSADVAYSLNRLRDPQTASPFLTLFPHDMSVQTPSDSTVVLQLNAPFAPLLPALSDSAASVVDRDAAEAPGGLDTNDGGTGPFTLSERIQDDHTTIARYPNYWQPGKPYLDTITFTWNQDANAQHAALHSGTVDFLVAPDATTLADFQSDSNLQIFGPRADDVMFLLMNIQKAPYSDLRVRQAIMYATGREEMRSLVNGDYGEPLLGGYLSPRRFGGLKTGIYQPTADIAKAQALMQEAGVSNFNAQLITIRGFVFGEKNSQVVQQQLQAIGGNLTIQAMDIPNLLSSLNSGGFDLLCIGLNTTLDPDQRLTPTFGTGGASNWAKWSNPDYDKLLADARTSTDPTAREMLYQQAETILATSGPMAFQYDEGNVDVGSIHVQGYVVAKLIADWSGLAGVWLDNAPRTTP
jgi:peptide/nickel transport system substrate-binding protein